MYLEFDTTDEPQIKGVRDGLSQVETGEAFLQRHPWYADLFAPQDFFVDDRWRKWATMPDYAQPLSQLALRPSAKLTDIVDASLLRGYFVSERVRQLLAEYHLPRHRYVPVSFTQRGQVQAPYWWLVYDLDGGQQTVDFAQSEFDLNWHERRFKHSFRIASYEDYLTLATTTRRAPPATKVVFTAAFDQNLDLWGMQFLLYRGYCSPRLQQALQQQGITGYSLRPPSSLLVFEQT